MRKIIQILKSINLVITLVFIISVTYSICYQIEFLSIPELFPNAYELGIIAFNLSLAIIASSIFYFIVIHINEYNNKQKAISIVRKKIQKLINIETTVTKACIEKTNYELQKENYSKENFKKLLREIKSTDVAPQLFFSGKEKNTWFEYLFYFVNDSQVIVKEIYQFMPYLELDLLVILNELEDSEYFSFFKLFKKRTFSYPNLSVIASYYHKYTILISRLEKYLVRVNKYYS